MTSDPNEFVQQAEALIGAEQYHEAVKVCRLGLLQSPGLVAGRVVLAKALMALGRQDEVLSEMHVALEADPDCGPALLLRGEALYLRGDLEEAEHSLRRAHEVGGTSPRLKHLLDEIADARRDGRLPDRTSEGPGTKEYPALRAFREGAAVDDDVPPDATARTWDYDEPDATMVDDRSPEAALGALLGQTPEATPGASAAPPGVDPLADEAEAYTTAWDPNGEESPTVIVAPTISPEVSLPEPQPPPQEPAAPLRAGPASVDQVGGEEDLALTETGSIQLGESDLVAEEADEDEGIEPDMTPTPVLIEADSSDVLEEPPTNVMLTPSAPPVAVAPMPSEPPPRLAPSRSIAPDDDDAPTVAQPAVAAAPAVSAMAPPAAAPVAVAPARYAPPAAAPDDDDAPTRLAGPSLGAQPRTPEDMTEPTVPAKRHAVVSNAPPRPAPASPSPALPPLGDLDGDTVEDDEEETTHTRHSPWRGRLPRLKWRELSTGPGRTMVSLPRLITLVAAAILFVVAVVLVVGALRSRHRFDTQLAVAARQRATNNYPGFQIALRAYERATAARPRDERALAARAFTAAALSLEFGANIGPAKEAVQAAKIRARGQPDLDAAEAYLALADSDLVGASLRARACASRHPKDPRGPYLEARVQMSEGSYLAAVPLLEEALRRNPKDVSALRALGLAHAMAGHLDKAQAAWDRALSLNAIHVASLLDRAFFGILRQGDLRTTETSLLSIASGKLHAYASPAQVAWANLGLGRLYLERGDGSRAAASLARAAADRPARAPRFADELCGAYLRAGEAARARKELPLFETLPRPTLPLRQGALAVLDGKGQAALDRLAKAPLHDPETYLWRGRALLQLKRERQALSELRAGLTRFPRFLPAKVEMSRIDIASGRADTAYRALSRLNEEEPGNAEVLEALGEALLARHDHEAARARFAEAVGRNPGLSRARLKLAQLLRSSGKWEQSRAHLEAALSTRPGYLEARRELAKLLYDLGDGTASRRAWEAVLAVRPDARAAIGAAMAAALGRDPVAAARFADRAQRLGAKRSLLLREWGRAAILRREAGKATSALRRAVSLNERDQEARALLVQGLLDAGETEAAQIEADQFFKRFPRSPRAKVAVGRVALANGETDAALASLRSGLAGLRAASAAPRRVADCLTLIGRALHYQGVLQRATATLEEARRADPHNAEAHYFNGVVLAELERFREAVPAFERAISLNPGLAEAWFRLAEARQRIKARGAAAAYREYLKLAPSGVYAADARERLQSLSAASPPATGRR